MESDCLPQQALLEGIVASGGLRIMALKARVPTRLAPREAADAIVVPQYL